MNIPNNVTVIYELLNYFRIAGKNRWVCFRINMNISANVMIDLLMSGKFVKTIDFLDFIFKNQ